MTTENDRDGWHGEAWETSQFILNDEAYWMLWNVELVRRMFLKELSNRRVAWTPVDEVVFGLLNVCRVQLSILTRGPKPPYPCYVPELHQRSMHHFTKIKEIFELAKHWRERSRMWDPVHFCFMDDASLPMSLFHPSLNKPSKDARKALPKRFPLRLHLKKTGVIVRAEGWDWIPLRHARLQVGSGRVSLQMMVSSQNRP